VKLITPVRLSNQDEIDLAKEMVEKSREKISLSSMEAQLSKENLLEIMGILLRAAADYDVKVQQIISAETELARWRAALAEYGLCECQILHPFYF
jgi:hypothetical protein